MVFTRQGLTITLHIWDEYQFHFGLSIFSLQLTGVTNYFEREVKRRAFVVQRWDFRETEKREIEAEAKKKAGVCYISSCSISKMES